MGRLQPYTKSQKEHKLKPNKSGRRGKTGIAIVAAPYHRAVREMIDIVKTRVGGSSETKLTAHQDVAGSFEIPLQVKRFLKRRSVAGVVVLGAIELGETGHGEAIANAVFPALTSLSLEFEKPVTLGIIGPKATPEQIQARARKVAEEAIEALLGQLQTT